MIETPSYLFFVSISGLYIYKYIKEYNKNKNYEKFTSNNFPKRGLANINDKYINKKKVKFSKVVKVN
tara:strand:- start:281 stop:481 length:201 start_codon:yes stop_codon:yes gene_type:complete